MSRIVPRQPVPALFVDTLAASRWNLADQKPRHFTLVAFYRGLHCPLCKNWLAQLDQRFDEFGQRGVQAIAISCDGRDRAEQSRKDWHLERVLLGYGLDIETARRWGLYISAAREENEPDRFSEPGLFLVQPDDRLYASVVSTTPFVRPHFDDVLKAVAHVVEKDYPARGES